MSAAEPRHRGAAALVLDRDGRVLLVNWVLPPGRWGLPGGRAEPEEEPHATAVREVREETGLVVEVERLVGVYGFDDEDGTPHLLIDVLLCAVADALAGRYGVVRLRLPLPLRAD